MLNYTIILIAIMLQSVTIFDFSSETNSKDWRIVNDGVMGGRSQGAITVNKEGHAEFEGTISLENYGGFSMVQYSFPALDTKPQNQFTLRIKGDGKRYQFRVRTNQSDRHAYIAYFNTNGQWQTIEIPFESMYPVFRGQKLNYPNFPGNQMEEIGFLIGNKKTETFKLVIDKITVE